MTRRPFRAPFRVEGPHRAGVTVRSGARFDFETVYGRLPVPLQNVICSAEGRRLERQRYGTGYQGVLADAKQRTRCRVAVATAYRDSRLQAFVDHCARTVPYYRRWFRENSVKPEDIRTLADLSALPVLTKAEVQADIADFQSDAVPRREQVATHTSGSTGAGLRFSTTVSAIREQYAVWWRYRGWHGLEHGIWCGHFGARSVVPTSQKAPPYWRYDRPGRRVMFSGYHMSESRLGAYIDELRKRRLPWLHGFPSTLALLAAHVVEHGVDLGYDVRWVTVGGENLLKGQEEVIARAFGVRPLQHYGLAEAVANISQCERGRLHVDEDFAAIEFLSPETGQGHRIIGCNFTNLATPLLRYDTGDLVTIDEEGCDCGRPGRVVAAIDGRQEDYVELANGARVGRMDHMFKDMTNIREAQIVQRRAGELEVRVVRGGGFSDSDERELLREMVKRVGEETAVRIGYVDHLERGPGGKLRFVVSEIP